MSEKSSSTTRNRVATAAGGGSVGVLLIWILTLFGVPIDPAAAAVLTAMITAGATALGRDGIKGIAKHLWSGFNGNGKNGE